MSYEIDVTLCETLAVRAPEDEGAWRALVEHLWPPLRGLVRASRTMGGFARSDDHVNDVLTKLVERLGREGRRGLQTYPQWRAKNQDKTFADWIRIVTANEIRRHVREQLGTVEEGSQPELPSVKRLLNEFSQSPAIEELGVRPPVTAAQTAQELLVFAGRRLPDVQCRALLSWIQGASFEEIAIELALDGPRDAERTLRAATAVLRRQFGAE